MGAPAAHAGFGADGGFFTTEKKAGIRTPTMIRTAVVVRTVLVWMVSLVLFCFLAGHQDCRSKSTGKPTPLKTIRLHMVILSRRLSPYPIMLSENNAKPALQKAENE